MDSAGRWTRVRLAAAGTMSGKTATKGYAALDVDDEFDKGPDRVSPEERASTCSFLFFLWLTPVRPRSIPTTTINFRDGP